MEAPVTEAINNLCATLSQPQSIYSETCTGAKDGLQQAKIVLGLKSVASIENGGPHRTSAFFSYGMVNVN
jgi:hypothetical protein